VEKCVNILYHTCIYNHLPEEEPSSLKHVEDIINQGISLENVHSVGLYCIIQYYNAQCKKTWKRCKEHEKIQ
jgi:hypothetical protein